jgi:hypothetical protein
MGYAADEDTAVSRIGSCERANVAAERQQQLNSARGLRVCGLGRGAWGLGLAAVRERAR